jgi:hypothetical protein
MLQVLDPFRFVLIAVAGWMNQWEYQIIDYLREENRVLREQLGQRRLRFNDDQRRRLAVRAKGLTRRLVEEMSPIVTWETLLVWHRKLIAQNTMAVATADQADRARRERSNRWSCAWQKKTEIGAIGVSRAHSLIWDTRWHAARLPTY